MDQDFLIKTLRRFATGKKLPTAQIQYLEEGGFICAADDSKHHLTSHGALILERNP